MKTYIRFTTILLFICPLLIAQNKITFSVDMSTLIENELFQPGNGDSLVVRGSFNNWNGNNQLLSDLDDDGIYNLTYSISGSVGDTIQYKFVIVKYEGFDSWEVNPNPENPDYGNRVMVLTGKPQSLPNSVFDIDRYIKFPVIFSKKELQEDFLQMRNALETIHPALYDFTDKDTFDELFENKYNLIDSNLSIEEFHRILEPIIAAVGCGHTGIWLPNNYYYVAPQRYFPLKLKFINDKVYHIGQYSDSSLLPIGSEIRSINNVPIINIIKTLKENHRADGFNKAFKSARVEKKFSKLYVLQYGYPKKFEVQYIQPKQRELQTIELQPVSLNSINSVPLMGNDLTIDIIKEKHIAVLTINTFVYYDQLEMFQLFIDSAF
ncbi:MAG: hypothetical protein JSW63_05480, partial [Ignavibacterium sp.]